ncbi:MAG: hypothetical protein LBV03_05975 [Fusobacteriales bacterium]|jgi:hypothetical protein|nr:hypothetical protein [Fusobacteriales bacterium]
MLNNHINIRIIANIERIISEKNKERAVLNFPRIRKKDLGLRVNDTLYRLRYDINYPNLKTLIIWADNLETDITEFFKPL